MNTKQLQTDFPEVQAAIYRVALSLDAFLLNGIPFGVIHRDVFNGFVEKTASNLLTALAGLEQQAPHAPLGSQTKVTEVLAVLRVKCRQLIEVVSGLSAFRTLPLQQVRGTVAQIRLLREECVQLIQEIECCFRTPKPFYLARPSESTATVAEFLGNLERVFMEEWAASNAHAVE